MKLSNAKDIVNGQLHGSDAEFQSISIDTRTIKAGELFIALNGPNFDGHDFLNRALEKNAAGAIVDRSIETPFPFIQVDNTLTALGKLGTYQRKQVSFPVIALTGSCGKTTTKTMIASILQQRGKVLATKGTLNNDIGVPLMLFKLNSFQQFAVIELGSNHFGEISYLTHLTQPNIALITNAGPSHLEGFGDIAGVAKEKGDIFKALHPGGVAIINADDAFCHYWLELVDKKKVLTFGEKNNADIRAKHITFENAKACFQLITPAGAIDIHLPLLGLHNISNALAAAATTFMLNIPIANIKEGLEAVKPIGKRLVEFTGKQGVRIIDDTYNANPASMKAAIEILSQQAGERFLVIGQMAELGVESKQYHSEIGKIAREAGIDALYACGKLSRFAVKSFGSGAYYYESQNALIDALKTKLNANIIMLVKGSRSMKMECVIQALT